MNGTAYLLQHIADLKDKNLKLRARVRYLEHSKAHWLRRVEQLGGKTGRAKRAGKR